MFRKQELINCIRRISRQAPETMSSSLKTLATNLEEKALTLGESIDALEDRLSVLEGCSDEI